MLRRGESLALFLVGVHSLRKRNHSRTSHLPSPIESPFLSRWRSYSRRLWGHPIDCIPRKKHVTLRD
ncbi:hypothetical protein NL676_027515 [Syzygium grande]|nr:hypothetical protein NL676_027515 [Syzygium grande]